MNKKSLNIELYKKVCLIRQTEKVIIENYNSDEMKTPMHMSMGEEAIVAGVAQALGKTHQAYGTYRSHGLYLALAMETEKFLSEMYGKETGVVKGLGGSMHLISPENNLLGVSAIVASTIPLAVGSAYANKVKKNNKIVAVFFGDGAVDEGVFWESLNLACLKKCPVLFVYQDNGYAVHTPPKLRHGYKDLLKIVGQYNCKILEENSTDPEKIYNAATKAIEIIQKNSLPVFLSTKYYRYLEHVGVFEDFKAGYRSKSEFSKWQKMDPIVLQQNKLLRLKISDSQIKKIGSDIQKQILKSLEKAKIAPFPKKEEMYKYLFANE